MSTKTQGFSYKNTRFVATFLFVIAVTDSSFSVAASGRIDGYDLKSCANGICAQLQSPVVFEGFLGILAFPVGSLVVTNQKTHKTTHYTGNGRINFKHQSIFIEEKSGHAHMYKIDTGEVLSH